MGWAKLIGSQAEVGFGEDTGPAEAPIRASRRRGDGSAWKPHRLAQETAGDRIEAIVASAAGGPPLSHFLDERRLPNTAMRGEAAGRENCIERIDDTQVFGAA